MALFRLEITANILLDKLDSKEGHAEIVADSSNRIMEQLIEHDESCDPFVHARLKDAVVEFGVTVEADTELEALERAVVLVRSAIHAADGETPGWEAAFRNLRPVAEELEAV